MPACFHLLLLAGTLLAAPVVAQPTGKPSGLPVKVAPVVTGVVSTEVTAVGTLIANESVMIRPEVAGRVTGIHFKEGQQVTAGQRLVSIDAAEIEAQRAATEAELVLNAQRHERAVELYSKKFISSQALDEARANLNRSKAKLAEDEARLRKSEVLAPFAGTLGLRQISPGAYVRAGEDIVRLEDTSVLKLEFRVPETFVARLRRDQEVVVQVDAYPERSYKGRTYAFDAGLDEKTRTVLARARVPNPRGELKPGMFARVALTLEQQSGALLIPEQAVVPRGGQVYVFRVVDGKADMVQVQTGRRQPGSVQVLKGLSVGDQVVTDGHQKLQPGVPVRILDAAGAPKPPADQAGANAGH